MADIDLATVLADGEYLKREGDVLVGDVPATGTPGGVDAEGAVDAVAAALVEGAGIDIVYDDGAGTITVASTITGGGGGTILDGTTIPSDATGIPGDYYEDTTNGVLYGPKLAVGWGAEQRPTVAGAPAATSSAADEVGCRYQFVRHGRVSRVRYGRIAAADTTLTIKAWNDSTQTKIAEIADTQAAVTAYFEVTFPTPIMVGAGETWTFTQATTGALPRNATFQTVTSTADVKFVEYRQGTTLDTYPAAAGGNTYFVEPIFELNQAWPVAVRTVAGYASAVRTINTYTAVTNTATITDAGRYLRFTGTNPTYTIPLNSAVAFPVGTVIAGIGTATAMTLVATGGVTLVKARTLVTTGAGSAWTAIKVATDTWDCAGDFV